jgi:hypothetical protein
MFARTAGTRAEAWVLAAEAMQQAHARLYNVVLEIEKPGLVTPQSRAVEAAVDQFLRSYDMFPIHTVAETIFPAAEYRQGGIEAVYAYPETIYPVIKSAPQNRWGTYALRMNNRKCSDGSDTKPLKQAIEKLKRQLETAAPKRAVYELDMAMEPLELKLYSTEDDFKITRAGQCLSHISLKLGPNRELYLTALYRNQFYIQKAIGNFLGLARLQAAIAREVGIPVGPLVCHATMAILEDKQLDNSVEWTRGEVTALVEKCKALLTAPAEVAA